MKITSVSPYNKPQFKGNLFKKGRYALEYIDNYKK